MLTFDVETTKLDGYKNHVTCFPKPMLTFDVETTGLDGYRNHVTCFCCHDSVTNEQRSFVFDQPPLSEDTLRKQAEVTFLLDTAETLCAFNGAKFDLPFMAKSWKVPDHVLGTWVAKLVDVFEASRLSIKTTFKLNDLLAANGLSSKTGSGLEAIRLAEQGQWEELADYCMQDVLLTYAVTTKSVVNLPKTHLKWSMDKGFLTS